jgi:hypothetical protein
MPASNRTSTPLTLGLLEKRIEGDDCLMELARLQFNRAGMEWAMKFRPSPEAPVVVHLARNFSLLDGQIRERIADFASRFAGRVHGFVIHDLPEMASRPADVHRAAQEMNSRLEEIGSAPTLFIEYAVGLDLGIFTAFFESIQNLSHLSACIDIGHVGIRQARKVYSEMHPGEDICSLKSDPSRLPRIIEDVQKAVSSVLPSTLELVRAIGSFRKPVHFHLHDGHPLSTFSPFGVSDHLDFSTTIPLEFEFRGRRSAPLMYGPDGLAEVAAVALDAIGAKGISMTLEIHPTGGRLPLGGDAGLFAHWRDKTNAERMNHWLHILLRNHELLRNALGAGTRGYNA